MLWFSFNLFIFIIINKSLFIILSYYYILKSRIQKYEKELQDYREKERRMSINYQKVKIFEKRLERLNQERLREIKLETIDPLRLTKEAFNPLKTIKTYKKNRNNKFLKTQTENFDPQTWKKDSLKKTKDLRKSYEPKRSSNLLQRKKSFNYKDFENRLKKKLESHGIL